MATYYISVAGSDSNNGLSADPTNGTNKPVATLAKVIGATGLAAAGDTVYIGPGVYRATTTLGVSGTLGNIISVIGDPTNSQNFKDSSGNLLSPGEVRVTNFVTNDQTSAVTAVVLNISSRSFLSFANIWFIGGTAAASGITMSATGGHDITFTACTFTHGIISSSSFFFLQNTTGQTAINILFDRCTFMPFASPAIQLILTRMTTGADYNCGIVVQNCLFLGGTYNLIATSAGAGTLLGGGVSFKNVTSLYPAANAVAMNDANLSSGVPCTVYNSFFYRTSSSSLLANLNGQIVEDYNFLAGRVNITGTNAGANTTAISSYCPMLDFGQAAIWGQYVRPVATPTIGSPMLGAGTASGMPAYDWLNRARPEGGKSTNYSIGYVERHDTGIKESGVVDSVYSVRLIGPSSQTWQSPVNATSTTISAKCQYDALHGTGTPPQLILFSSPDLGLVDNFNGSGINQIITAPNTSGVWNTLTLSAFTPTKLGVVRVAGTNRSAAASGNVYFDTFTVT